MNGSPHYLIGYFRGLLRTAKDKSMSDTYVLNELHRILAEYDAACTAEAEQRETINTFN